MKSIRVAVLGANGQVGSALVRQMTAVAELKPVAVCRNQVGATVLRDLDCDIRLGSVADEEETSRLLDDCDVVVNCVWPVGSSKEITLENRAIIRNLARLKSLKRMIHLSSVAVYGCIHNRSTFSRPRPDTSYGTEKLQLEKCVAKTFTALSAEWLVMRLGHVFGPHQWLSRDVIDLAKSGAFKLPFNGECPSNAIHVDEAAIALTWLVSAPIDVGIYNLAGRPHQTWREIFDWHSKICGLQCVEGMSHEDSEALRQGYIRRSERPFLISLCGEVSYWLRSLPVQRLLTAANVRRVGGVLLQLMPFSARSRITSARALGEVRRAIDALQRPASTPAPWLYSDGMPERYLEPPLSTSYTSALSKREQQILEWYRTRSEPQWSLDDSPERSTDLRDAERWITA